MCRCRLCYQSLQLLELCGVDAGAVNVKGKTLEGMGALAGGAGVAVQAVCLLETN